MPGNTTAPLVVIIDGVEHRLDMDEIDALRAQIAAGPGDSSREKLALSLAGNPLVSAGEPLQPDPDSRGD